MYFLNICFLDDDPEKIQKENPISCALHYLPFLFHFSVISRKTRYYCELIIQDTGSYTFSHRFCGDSHHQIPYNFELYKSCIAYSKAIITKIISYEEYGNPKATRRISSVVPQGIPYEYNYWDYITACSKVFLYQNLFGKHSWSFRLDLPKLIKFPSSFA